MKDLSVEELLEEITAYHDTHPAKEHLRRFEDSKCCGNCSKIHKYDCAKRTEEVLQHCTAYQYPHENNYCDSWQSDGLTREEREGK